MRILQQWFETSRKFLPEGTFLLQSSSSHIWPYPAYLYGKGTWAAVDILYFMYDIPITFMGEIDGEVFRIGQTQLFQHEQTPAASKGLKRSNSQIMMALGKADEEEEEKKVEKEIVIAPELRRGMTRVRSGSNLSALLIEQKQGGDLK